MLKATKVHRRTSIIIRNTCQTIMTKRMKRARSNQKMKLSRISGSAGSASMVRPFLNNAATRDQRRRWVEKGWHRAILSKQTPVANKSKGILHWPRPSWNKYASAKALWSTCTNRVLSNGWRPKTSIDVSCACKNTISHTNLAHRKKSSSKD